MDIEITEEQRARLRELQETYGPGGPKRTYAAERFLRILIDEGRWEAKPRPNKEVRNAVRDVLWPCVCEKDDRGLVLKMDLNCPNCCFAGRESPRPHGKMRTQLAPDDQQNMRISKQFYTGMNRVSSRSK